MVIEPNLQLAYGDEVAVEGVVSGGVAVRAHVQALLTVDEPGVVTPAVVIVFGAATQWMGFDTFPPLDEIDGDPALVRGGIRKRSAHSAGRSIPDAFRSAPPPRRPRPTPYDLIRVEQRDGHVRWWHYRLTVLGDATRIARDNEPAGRVRVDHGPLNRPFPEALTLLSRAGIDVFAGPPA